MYEQVEVHISTLSIIIRTRMRKPYTYKCKYTCKSNNLWQSNLKYKYNDTLEVHIKVYLNV